MSRATPAHSLFIPSTAADKPGTPGRRHRQPGRPGNDERPCSAKFRAGPPRSHCRTPGVRGRRDHSARSGKRRERPTRRRQRKGSGRCLPGTPCRKRQAEAASSGTRLPGASPRPRLRPAPLPADARRIILLSCPIPMDGHGASKQRVKPVEAVVEIRAVESHERQYQSLSGPRRDQQGRWASSAARR
jgi:hypothetical protein